MKEESAKYMMYGLKYIRLDDHWLEWQFEVQGSSKVNVLSFGEIAKLMPIDISKTG